MVARVLYSSFDYGRSMELVSLGGDNSLRGYPADFRLGTRLVNVNVEVRSRPLVWRTLHLGLALFYDGGDAWMHEQGEPMQYHHSVGIGLRGLFPQFDKGVVRLDLGFPLDRVPDPYSMVTFSYLQAF